MKQKQKQLPRTPTEAQFTALNQAYQYFNQELFGGILPGCILNFSRKRNTHGFLAPKRWRRVGEKEYSTHEISLTPTTLFREPIEVFSTLVHEQVHLWQWEFGRPSRSGYHNKEWARKMEEVGLMPSDTGKADGKKNGTAHDTLHHSGRKVRTGIPKDVQKVHPAFHLSGGRSDEVIADWRNCFHWKKKLRNYFWYVMSGS